MIKYLELHGRDFGSWPTALNVQLNTRECMIVPVVTILYGTLYRAVPDSPSF